MPDMSYVAAPRPTTSLPAPREMQAYLDAQSKADPRLGKLLELLAHGDWRDASGKVQQLQPAGVSNEIGALIHWLVRERGARSTLETGFGYGVSAAFFALAAPAGSGARHLCLDPYLEWTGNFGTRLLEELGVAAGVQLERQESFLALAEMCRRKEPVRIDIALLDGSILLEEMMADFAMLERLMSANGVLLVRQPYLPQVRAFASFLASNTDFHVHEWSVDLWVAIRQTRDEERPWYHFEPFEVPFEGRPDYPAAGLARITAPDGQPFVFADESCHQQYLRRVLHGIEYPLLVPDVYRATTILDIGAHVGSAARFFAHSYPQARIVCIEPTPESHALLARNTGHLPNVERHAIAFADEAGTLRIYRGRHSSGQNSALPNEENSDSSFEVPARVPLDFCRSQGIERISILKMDIEGMELDVLASLAPLIEQIDVVYVEYHSEHIRRTIERILASFTLFASSATEAFRGTAAYARTAVLNDCIARSGLARYCFPKPASRPRTNS